jgi:hypothetical protein
MRGGWGERGAGRRRRWGHVKSGFLFPIRKSGFLFPIRQFWVNPSGFQANREVAGGILWDWIRSAREIRAQSAAAF